MKKVILLVSLLSLSVLAEWAFVRDSKVQFRSGHIPSTGRIIATQQVVFGLQGADPMTQRACGWYPVVDTNATQQGMRVTATRMTVGTDCVMVERDYAPIPPRNFEISKFKLLTEIDNAGKFNTFKAWFDALPEKQRMLWDAAITLDSTNVLVQGAMQMLPEILGVPASDMTNILGRSRSK